MLKLSYSLSWFLFFSCSSVTFLSANNISTSFDYEDSNTSDVRLRIEKDFYMWGLYPREEVVKVDEVFLAQGHNSVSDLVIKEVDTTNKAVWMLFTFGMYYPQSFELTAKVN